MTPTKMQVHTMASHMLQSNAHRKTKGDRGGGSVLTRMRMPELHFGGWGICCTSITHSRPHTGSREALTCDSTLG